MVCEKVNSHVIYLIFFVVVTLVPKTESVSSFRNFACGPYGFICESGFKLRLCDGSNLFGPNFLCPSNTICNEDSSDVCENTVNYIDPLLSRNIRCRRNERLADQSVPECKGYILCIPNKNRFQGIKFKCAGNTIFNGVTRSCTSPDNYKCPLTNTTKQTTQFYEVHNRKSGAEVANYDFNDPPAAHTTRPIDCKNYKFTVTQNDKPAKATFFCPAKPAPGERTTRCTIFSNQFCITLERDDEDQFSLNTGVAYRRPRLI